MDRQSQHEGEVVNKPWTVVTLGIAALGAMGAIGPIAARAAWERQSGAPAWAEMKGIAAATPLHVFAVDQVSGLVESTDGGTSWVRRTLGTNPGATLYDIFFLDATHGWVGGTAEYFRTTDAGATWLQSPDNDLGSVDRIRFVTPSFGWATTINGLQSFSTRSTDGGATWAAVSSAGDFFRILDERGGILLGRSLTQMVRSTNQGNTWAPAGANPGGNATDGVLLTSSVGLLADGQRIRRSTNGGASWTTVVASAVYNRVTRISDSKAIAWFGNEAAVTTDAGATWQPVVGGIDDQAEPVWAGVHDVLALDETTLIASTIDGKIRRSINSGLSWTTATPHPRSGFPLWRFTKNGASAFGVGMSGMMFTSHDLGATWSHANAGCGELLNDIKMWDETRGIAVGEQGVLLWTTDGGANWVPRRPLVENGAGSNYLYSVSLVPPSFGYAVGDFGYALRTTNAGSSWELMPGPIDRPEVMQAVDFVSPTHGWLAVPCCGSIVSGLYESTDGGSSWTRNIAASSFIYVDVDFFDDNLGFATSVSTGGSVLRRTTNGGVSWQFNAVDLTRYTEFVRISFQNATTGWGAGYTLSDDGTYWDAYIGKTTNAGVTWVRQAVSYPAPPLGEDFLNLMKDVVATSDDEVWAVGLRGIVHHSTNGGSTWETVDPEIPSLGAPNEILNAVDVTPLGRVFAAGNQGKVMAAPGGGVTGVEAIAAPQLHMLGTPFPNPSTSAFQFTLAMREGAAVKVDVLDVTGRRVATILDRQVEPGRHALQWDGAGRRAGDEGSAAEARVAPGIYFVRLEAGDHREVRRAVVLE